MFAYAVRRILQFIPTILAVTFIIFLLLNVLPGNAALMAAGEQDHNIDAHYIEQMKKDWGLDKPVWLRFVIYVKDLCHRQSGTVFSAAGTGRPTDHGPALADAETGAGRHGHCAGSRHSAGVLFRHSPGTLAGHLQHDGRRFRGFHAPVLAGAFADVFYLGQIAPAAAPGLRRRVDQKHHFAGLHPGSCLHGASGPNHPGGGGGDPDQRLYPHRARQRAFRVAW